MSEDIGRNGLLARVEEFIGCDLHEADEIYLRELESAHPYVSDILKHVTHFRGKRLRPMLLLLSAAATGDINSNHKVLGAVVEMIHTATLVHDDVLDEAATRRHVATVNSRWNNETSVLFGDYLFTHAFHLASSLESTVACRLIGRATNIVCEGELAQVHERGNIDLTEDSYLKIIDYKTAELCAVCCRLGAYFSNADPAIVESLESYGRSLGMAFQIADDLLDILGNETETGKSLGTDWEKQKLTLPLIRLLSTADESERPRIRELLSQPSQESWTALSEMLAGSDAIEYSYNRATGFAADALRHLECTPMSTARQLLEEIVEFAAQRTF